MQADLVVRCGPIDCHSSLTGGRRGAGAVLTGIVWAPEQDRLWDRPRNYVCRVAL